MFFLDYIDGSGWILKPGGNRAIEFAKVETGTEPRSLHNKTCPYLEKINMQLKPHCFSPPASAHPKGPDRAN